MNEGTLLNGRYQRLQKHHRLFNYSVLIKWLEEVLK